MRPKDCLILFIKGFILGVANVIPGVSGGTLAVSLGLYERVLECVTTLFKKFKENLTFIMPIALGIGVAILSTSKLVTYALTNFKAQTIFLFVGLIFGGISLIMKKVKGQKSFFNICVFCIVFIFVLGLNFVKTDTFSISFTNMNIIDYVLLALVGFIASSAMVIPGISGSFVLMVFGYYEKIMATISHLTTFKNIGQDLIIITVFGIGVLLGILFMAKLITKLIEKNEVRTYFAIMGFVLSSIVVLLIEIGNFKFNFTNIATSILAFLWGYLLSRAIDKE